MQFVIEAPDANTPWIISRLKNYARKVIILHRLLPSEVKLNNYLKEKYNLDLIGASLMLLRKSTWHKNLSNAIIVVFNDKEDDKLASLITYGNLEIPGSDILKEAFFRKD